MHGVRYDNVAKQNWSPLSYLDLILTISDNDIQVYFKLSTIRLSSPSVLWLETIKFASNAIKLMRQAGLAESTGIEIYAF